LSKYFRIERDVLKTVKLLPTIDEVVSLRTVKISVLEREVTIYIKV
jgi:hypothetical protein